MLFTQPLISALNKVLKNNEGSLNLLKANAGKSFGLNIAGISLAGTIENDGFLVIPQVDEYTVEIDIPFSAATYLINKDRLSLIKQLTFTGDKQFGRELLEILSNLNLQISASNTTPLVSMVLVKIGNILNAAFEQLKLSSSNATNSITEYLLYENEELITQHEMNKFCTEVDDIRMHADRIEKHIALLKSRSA